MSYQESKDVTVYIAQFDHPVRDRLTQLRHLIQSRFPHSIEDISYGMPCYRPATGKRGVVYFAAAKKHIGLYAVVDAEPNEPIHPVLQKYKTGRGTLQFKNTAPFPIDSINEILLYQATKLTA